MPRTETKQRTCPTDSDYLSPAAAKGLRDALSRIEGHVGAVRRMVDGRRCCDEILTQVAAVRSALNRVAVELVEKELLRCLSAWSTKDAVEAERRFNEAMKALSLMIKQS